jgi:molybdopterin-guanine dinucleotide biosynthesis protein
VRARALIHIGGPAGAGKTTFIERLLEARVAHAICVRAVQDPKLRREGERESAPKEHIELRRYRKSGAGAVALYRFREPSVEAFFMTVFMQDYSQAVFIEGDRPLHHDDLTVFVARVPAKGRSLLRRVVQSRAVSRRAEMQQMKQLYEALEDPAFARLGGPGRSESFEDTTPREPDILQDFRRLMEVTLEDARRSASPAPTQRRVLAADYEGIEQARLVIVNVRDDKERPAAQALLDELDRLRKDEILFREVFGWRASRLPITAVVANLSDPMDAGLKKAVARVKRITTRRT